MTLTVAVITTALGLLIIGFSLWQLSGLAISLLIIGFGCFAIRDFQEAGSLDYLLYISEFIVLGFIYYFVMLHKAMKSDVLTPVSRQDFRDYLVQNGSFHGFNKLIYNLPILIGAITLIFVLIYYLRTPGAFQAIGDYFGLHL